MTLAQDMFDGSIRPAIILHLGTMLADCEAVPDVLADAFEEDSEYIREALGIDEESSSEDLFELQDILAQEDRLGFLVKFETPIPQYFFDRNSFRFSWSYYTSKWIYGKTYNQCCKKALKWREKYIILRRKKTNETNQILGKH